MKRNLLLIIGVFIGVLVILLMGNVITVAEKLGEICHTVYVEYAFYALILVLLIAFVLIPIIKVHTAPEFPAMRLVDETADMKKLRSFAKRLVSGCGYIEDAEVRASHQKQIREELESCSEDMECLKAFIDREVTLRFDGNKEMGVPGINSRMKEWAKSVFMITAVSQNNLVDSAVLLVMNYRQVEDLVLATGFRPTRAQMFRIYANILTTTLVSYCTSEVLSDLAGETTLAGAMANLKIPGVISESAIQGAVNALLTLRIGYVTRTFLMEGPDALAGRQRRREVSLKAFKEAFVAIPGVLAGTAATMGKGLMNLFKGKKSEPAAEQS
ncbi:MAG: DUF697 domain-containing protein [Bacteroidales bacterium]|nr:DUF697 domain-containing protein [Bacteroidales bacterium]